MKKEKTNSKAYEINKKLRRKWNINPVTKIKEDDRINEKKRRQNEKKEITRFNIDESN